jgi:hypothetical protein
MKISDSTNSVRGQGCVVYLGLYHEFARLAMVKHAWSQHDKENYKATGIPPLFVGMIPSETEMVTFSSLTTRFRSGYAPDEGTFADVRGYVRGSPCLLVVTTYADELCHLTAQRWVIPSAYMPQFQVFYERGNQVKLDNPNNKSKDAAGRLKLLLAGGISIGRFTTADEDLHTTIYSFLKQKTTTIGIDAVEVEDTKPYLKTVGEYKRLGEQNFHQILRGNLPPKIAAIEDDAGVEAYEDGGETRNARGSAEEDDD